MITHWFRFYCEKVDTQHAEDFYYVLILRYQSVQVKKFFLKQVKPEGYSPFSLLLNIKQDIS